MRKKVLSVLVAVSMIAALLTGCGATNESVITKMVEKTSSSKSVDANMIFDLSMSMTSTDDNSAETSMSMALGVDANIQTLKSSETDSVTKLEGNVNANLFGFDMKIPVLAYSDLSDDSLVTYSYDSDSKSWKKETSDDIDSYLNMSSIDFTDYTDSLELSKDKVEIDGNKCYQLTGTVSGDKFSSVFGDALEDSTLEDIDYSSLVADVVLYVNSKTYYPVSMTADFSNSDFSSLTESSDEDTFDLFGDVTYSVDTFKVSITYNGFDTIDSLDIPEDALNAVEEDDSNFILGNGVSETDSEITFNLDDNEDSSELASEDTSLDNWDWISYVDNNYPTQFDDEVFSYQMWSYTDDSDEDTVYYVVEVTNITDDAVCGEGAIRAYDVDGNLVDADSYSTPTLASGQSYAEVYYIDKSAESVELSLMSDTVFDSPADITVTEKEVTDDEIKFDVTNNGDEDLSNHNIMVVFFKGEQPVDYTYLRSDSTGLTAGETVEMSAYLFEDFDSYKVYPVCWN